MNYQIIAVIIAVLLIAYWFRPSWFTRLWTRESYVSMEPGREMNWEADSLGISHTMGCPSISI